MSDPGDGVRQYWANLSRQRDEEERRHAEWLKDAKRLRFAWIEGYDTLYKFKSLSGESKDQVLDIIENSRIYFSVPDQFNDPLDCSPVIELAKDPSDPDFVEELQAEEAEFLASQGKTAEEIATLRKSEGVGIRKVGSLATMRTRKQLREESRIFCLTARRDHPLLWSHYADSHRGICLHFHCRGGTVFGAARAVEYQQERWPIFIPMKYNASGDDIADAMSRTKADFWRYEEEYRIIGYEGVDWGQKLDGRFCSFEPNLLSGITLGMSISRMDRDAVLKWVEHRPAIAVYQAEENSEKFWLNFWRIR